MKKDRNTFFSNYSNQTQSYFPDFNNLQPPNQTFGPYQSANTNSSIYTGPDIQMTNEIDNRLSKIERQINRLESRISKLENTPVNQTEQNNNTYTNMYMI